MSLRCLYDIFQTHVFAICEIDRRFIGIKVKVKKFLQHSPYVGQGVPAGPQVVITTQLADATLLGLHPSLRRRGGGSDHVVLVPARGTRRRDAPAETPTTAPVAALCRRLFRLIRSENGVENIRWHTNVFTSYQATQRTMYLYTALVLKVIILSEYNA